MTKEEIKKINDLFSNLFDVIYNNITSNQAPGLNEYEKSIFLNIALYDIVKGYFDSRKNKVQQGFDDTEERLIDFSMLIKSQTYKKSHDTIVFYNSPPPGFLSESYNSISLIEVESTFNTIIKPDTPNRDQLIKELEDKVDDGLLLKEGYMINTSTTGASLMPAYVYNAYYGDSSYDYRSNSKSIIIPSDIFMMLNERVVVSRNGLKRLTVLPINYQEYQRLTSKAYARPLKNQAWRLLDNTNGVRKSDLIVGPGDTIQEYTIRYVKRPQAIRLIDFTNEGVTIENGTEEQCCELDPILWDDIIQRACEFAKASYAGDLTSQIALGQSSQTDLGIVAQSR